MCCPALSREPTRRGTRILLTGLAVAVDLAVLGFFKYIVFVEENLNSILLLVGRDALPVLKSRSAGRHLILHVQDHRLRRGCLSRPVAAGPVAAGFRLLCLVLPAASVGADPAIRHDRSPSRIRCRPLPISLPPARTRWTSSPGARLCSCWGSRKKSSWPMRWPRWRTRSLPPRRPGRWTRGSGPWRTRSSCTSTSPPTRRWPSASG